MNKIIMGKLKPLSWIFVLIVGSVSNALGATPSITSFTPKKGSVGDNIIINGGGFVFANLSSNKVRFSGKRAIVAVAPTATQLVVTVPDDAKTGPITIDNSSGSVDSQEFFEFIPTKNTISSSGSLPGPGDRKILDTYMSGFKMADMADSPEYYAPPGSILWVVSRVDDKGYVIVHFSENWTDKKVGTETNNKKYKEISKGGSVESGVKYTVKAVELQNTATLSQGVDYGVLVLPFKFHFSDQSLTGEATLGGYAGWQWSWPGVAITFPVISAGVGIVNTTQQNGTSTSTTLPSFTFAGGLIINLTKSELFQIGIIVGADWSGKNSQYKYEGEPWIAVSFGTNFTK